MATLTRTSAPSGIPAEPRRPEGPGPHHRAGPPVGGKARFTPGPFSCKPAHRNAGRPECWRRSRGRTAARKADASNLGPSSQWARPTNSTPPSAWRAFASSPASAWRKSTPAKRRRRRRPSPISRALGGGRLQRPQTKSSPTPSPRRREAADPGSAPPRGRKRSPTRRRPPVAWTAPRLVAKMGTRMRVRHRRRRSVKPAL